MEDIMEIVFTLAAEIIGSMRFKKPQTRVRAMTALFIAFFGLLSVSTGCGAIALFREGSTTGAIIVGVIALAFAVVGATVVTRGHKTDWNKY